MFNEFIGAVDESHQVLIKNGYAKTAWSKEPDHAAATLLKSKTKDRFRYPLIPESVTPSII
ncbi:hypothetical protein J2TS6_01110 [Paenibacillus albilobatus]|uniref:Uncharacterized protein n=1 Tax=Paenibacillus albilobatus TaxID=2716884 RepID=A0A919XE62_9BACL|nr:hypothetical protein J2TS6_01110 [Paenibacillus albilobatus]